MKNYYEILQVNENASIEIIEKAHKVLVKKYHPDLQKDIKEKHITEQKLKLINEAYDVLSNEFLKEQYDIELKKEKEERLKRKYGNSNNYQTERRNFYTQTKQDYKRNQKTQNHTNCRQLDKKSRYENIGTFAGLIDFIKVLYNDRPKMQEIKEITKKDIIAIFLTILVVLAIRFNFVVYSIYKCMG